MNGVPTGSQSPMAQNAPSNSGSLTCGHLAWPRVLLCVMALGIGVSIGHGQWLETRITLPDSLGGATGPTCLTTDTSERYVYIGDGSGAVYVVDAEVRTRVARVPCSGYVSALCTNTRRNKVYAADDVGSQVIVISCATNQVVATIRMGAAGLPTALCYNSNDDKVYVACDGGDLTVIECSSDSVIKTIHLGEGQVNLCFNPAGNRVFCATYDTLLVIDGANDSVVAVYAGAYYGSFVVNAVASKVYVASYDGSDSGVLVLDGTTGVVLGSMNARAEVMCLNSRTQKLYTGGKTPCEIMIFDCAADTLIDWFRLSGQSYIYSIACDTATGKVFASFEWNTRDRLVVIDGLADTIAATIPGPRQGELLVSSKRDRVYSTDVYGPELAVFDTGTDSLLRTIMIGGWSEQMCYDSTDVKVYYVSYSVLGEAGAIDAATNQPVGHIRVGPYPQDVIWHAPTNRVYCSGGNITVIDPTADTVTKVLAVNSGLLCSAPSLNKVYACSGQGLAVIDCRNDSVVKTIPIPTFDAWSMCYVAYDKLYVGGVGAVSIVDCIGDTLIRSYPFSFSRLVPGREGKRVYCWRPNSLCTFDPAGDTLVAEATWEAGSAQDLLYVPDVNKVYCAAPGNGPGGEGCVLVANGATDSVITEIPLRMAWALGYDSVSGVVYCGQGWDSTVTFIDSRTDSVVGSLNTGICPKAFVTVAAHSRVYVGGWGNSFIPVIRTDLPGVEEAALSFTKKLVGPTLVSKGSPLVIHQPSALLDAVGRKVLDLKPGLRGLTGCRTGVYFIRTGTAGIITKILLVD
jgi:DNA-binding beta-propeller fold protein YncE